MYDSSGNNLGTYRVQSDYAQRNSNNLRMAMKDYIEYLEKTESKEVAAKALENLRSRASKFGVAIPDYAIGSLGTGLFEQEIARRERAEYKQEQARKNRIANEKYAKELGYSSYAELVRARNKRKAAEKAARNKRKAAEKAARKAKPSGKEIRQKEKADAVEWKKNKGKREIERLEKERNKFLEDEKYNEALIILEKLIQLDASALNINYRGMCKLYLDDIKAAEVDFTKAVELDPEFIDALSNLKITKFKNKDYEGALDVLNKLIKILKTPDTLLDRGNLLFRLEKYYDAVAAYMEALELNPVPRAKVDILLGLSRTKEKLNDIEGAKDGYNQILKYESQQPQALDALLGIKYIPRLDVIYDNEGRSEKLIKLQIEYYNERIKIFPKWIQGYRVLMESNFALSYFEEAIKHSIILIDLSATQGKGLTTRDYNQIAVLYRETKQLYKAISFYNKALEVDPLYPTAIGGLGTTKLYLGDVNGACEEWNKAVNLEKISDDSKQHYSGLITENCNSK